MFKKEILLILALIAGFVTIAQPKKRKNQIEYINSIQLIGGLGTGTYFGDLCDNMECAVFRPNTVLGVAYRNSARLLLRSEFNFARVYGSDEGGKNYIRNLHFRSNIYEVNVNAVYDIIPYERKFRYRAPFTPFLHGGIGAAYFNPKAELNGNWVKLRPLQTEGRRYGSITPVITYGLGVRYKATPELNISLEAGYRWTFTDYLDDVSSVYVDNSTLTGDAKILADRTNELSEVPKSGNYIKSQQHWRTGHIRGNPKRNDGYFLLQVKAEYRIKWTLQGKSILPRPKFR